MKVKSIALLSASLISKATRCLAVSDDNSHLADCSSSDNFNDCNPLKSLSSYGYDYVSETNIDKTLHFSSIENSLKTQLSSELAILLINAIHDMLILYNDDFDLILRSFSSFQTKFENGEKPSLMKLFDLILDVFEPNRKVNFASKRGIELINIEESNDDLANQGNAILSKSIDSSYFKISNTTIGDLINEIRGEDLNGSKSNEAIARYFNYLENIACSMHYDFYTLGMSILRFTRSAYKLSAYFDNNLKDSFQNFLIKFLKVIGSEDIYCIDTLDLDTQDNYLFYWIFSNYFNNTENCSLSYRQDKISKALVLVYCAINNLDISNNDYLNAWSQELRTLIENRKDDSDFNAVMNIFCVFLSSKDQEFYEHAMIESYIKLFKLFSETLKEAMPQMSENLN